MILDAICDLLSNSLFFFQIRALQNDLHKNHFKATEERRIVAEIDKLNRSRRAIKEFNSVREEVDELKMTQKELRDHRDQMFKVRTYLAVAEL